MASKQTKTGSITQSLLPYCAKCNPFSENEFLVGSGDFKVSEEELVEIEAAHECDITRRSRQF